MNNRKALTQAEKDVIYQLKQGNQSYRSIAAIFHCSPETVRKHWKAHRRGTHARPRGRPNCGILSVYPEVVRARAIAIKQAHPHWGPANVRIELQQMLQLSEEELPSCSRLSALFHQSCPEAVQPRHPRRDNLPLTPTHQIHERWQMDAIEKIRLGNGELATILDIRDPASGLIISSQAFQTTNTPNSCRRLTFPEIRGVLRQAFSLWGRPAEIQTDHEAVYVGSNQADFPTYFTLWLLGLGIRHMLSRDGRPTDQAHVERQHRTLADMSWKNQPPPDLTTLQQELDLSRERYHYLFPVQAADCAGQPPLVRHPTAVHSGRPYLMELEWDLFSLEQVDAYLAGFHWVRKSDVKGVVWIGGHTYNLFCAYRHTTVSVCFDEQTRCFCFKTHQGDLIQMYPAKSLSKEDLLGLLPACLPNFAPVQLPLPFVGV